MSPTQTYVPSLRGDAMLLTHGGGGVLVGAAVLLDAVLEGSLDVRDDGRVVTGREFPGGPLLADLRRRVAGGAPASAREWIVRAAAFAPHRISCELIAAGVAAPLDRRFGRRYTLAVDARAEAQARARIASDEALAGLLYVVGHPTGDPLAPATHALPDAARTVLHALRAASVEATLTARIAG